MVLGLRWQTVAEIFPQEQENHLKERARPPYGCYRIVQTAVNSYCLVNFEGNRYSTPCHLVRRQVSFHVYLDKIQIVDGQEVLAEHIRLYGKGQTAYRPQHYLPLLKRKPGALGNGEPFKQWILPPAVKELQKHLMKQKSADRAMVEISAPIAGYGGEAGVTAAVGIGMRYAGGGGGTKHHQPFKRTGDTEIQPARYSAGHTGSNRPEPRQRRIEAPWATGTRYGLRRRHTMQRAGYIAAPEQLKPSAVAEHRDEIVTDGIRRKRSTADILERLIRTELTQRRIRSIEYEHFRFKNRC